MSGSQVPGKRPTKVDLDKLQRQIDASKRFAETGRTSDLLEARGQDPNSAKSSFTRGAEAGCGMTLVLAAGTLALFAHLVS